MSRKGKHKKPYDRSKFCRFLLLGLRAIGKTKFPNEDLTLNRILEECLIVSRKERMRLDFNAIYSREFTRTLLDYELGGYNGEGTESEIRISLGCAESMLQRRVTKERDVQGFKNMARVFWEFIDDEEFGDYYKEHLAKYGKTGSPLG